MAQLPDYTALPSAPPSPAYRKLQPDTSGAQIGQAIDKLGNSIEQNASQQHIQNVNLARAQASNALLDHEIQVRTVAQGVNQDVADGKLDYNDAQQSYQDKVAKIESPAIPNLDPVAQENLQKGVTRNVFTSGLQVTAAVDQARKNDFKDQFAQNLDKLGILAGMPNADIQGLNDKADAFGPLARQAGLPAPLVDETLTKFKEQNWFNNATQRAMEAKENPQALQQLQHDLVDENGFFAGRLNTERRNSVLRTVENDQLMLENRAEHLQDKREAKAVGAVNQINEQISTGIPATPGMWDNWNQLTKGTAMEPEFTQAQADETKIQQVLRLPIEQQQAYVQQRAAALDNPAIGGTLRDHANLIRLQTAVNQNVNLMQRAPLLFSANRNGTDVTPLSLDKAGQPGGQAEIAGQIADRMSTLAAVRKQYGPAVALAPLLPEEAQSIGARLNQSTPQSQYQLLSTLSSSFQNGDAFQAAMRQIAPHSPVAAIVGSRIGANVPSDTPVWFNRNFTMPAADAQVVLRGESLLNPTKADAAEKGTAQTSTFPMPTTANSGQTLQQVYGKAAAGLFPDRPQLADAHFAVFRAAYAGLLAQSGDMKGTADPRIERKALDIALGTQDQRVDINGSTLRVPDGMDPGQFQGNVKNAILAVIKGSKAPPDWQDRMRGYQLREVGGLGSGQYRLTNGDAELARPDGKGPFVIDLNKQFIARPGIPTYSDQATTMHMPVRGNPALAPGAEQ